MSPAAFIGSVYLACGFVICLGIIAKAHTNGRRVKYVKLLLNGLLWPYLITGKTL